MHISLKELKLQSLVVYQSFCQDISYTFKLRNKEKKSWYTFHRKTGKITYKVLLKRNLPLILIKN